MNARQHWLRVVVVAFFFSPLLGRELWASNPVRAEVDNKLRPMVRLDLEPANAVLTGQFSPGTELQEARFEHPVKGRYFCLETLSAQDGRAYAAVAELDLLDASGQCLIRKGWKIAYADSEEHEREDGLAENAIDGDPTTFWHTQWSRGSPNHPHHLVVDLGTSRELGGFRYLPRAGEGSVGGRIKDYRVYVGDDLLEKPTPDKELPDKFYLLAYFVGSGESGLRLAYSLNGYRWDVLNQGNSVLKPEVGGKLMRDPCLLRAADGTYHMVWTAAWTGNYIGYASSPDLIHWSAQAVIPVMTNEPAVRNCWAPEVVQDPRIGAFLIFWASTVSSKSGETFPPKNHRIYSTRTTDFAAFTPAKLFYDPGFSLLDATLLAGKGRYYLCFKDDTVSRLRIAASDNWDGPFGQPGAVIEDDAAEGPMLFHLGDQTMALYHVISAKRCGAVRSTDLEHWEDVSAGMFLPPDCEQGTVLELPGTQLQPLLQAGWLELGATPAVAELGVGDWIWTTNVTDRQVCRLWRAFDIPPNSPVARALMVLTADNSYIVYLDGREIGRGSDPSNLAEYDLTLMLSPGRHVLAVEAFNDTFDAGMIFGLRVKLANGKKIELFSDAKWRIAAGNDRAWLKQEQAEAGWPAARVVGYAGKAWWPYPNKIVQVPPLQPAAIHFWQQGWVLVGLLLACLTVAVMWLRQRFRLTLHKRANTLLERERARIARDLHDDLGSGLTQLTLLGELVLRETAPEGEARVRLNQLCTKARLLLRSMDEVIWVVNPRRDTVKDFAAFISEYAQEFLMATAIRCRQSVAEELPVLPLELPQRRNLWLAVKEAVRNAARHSGADEVTLKVGIVDGSLQVVVEDNGRGFSPAAAPEGRRGLANMRQRLADIGGSLSLRSAPGQGCCLTFLLPLTAHDNLAETSS